jgi:hypothetical protein
MAMVGANLDRLEADKKRKESEEAAKEEASKKAEAKKKETCVENSVLAKPYIDKLMQGELPLDSSALAERGGIGLKLNILKAIVMTLGGKCGDGKKEDVAKLVVELVQTRKANAPPRDVSGGRHGLGGGGAAGAGGAAAGAGGEKAGTGADGAAAGMGPDVKLLELPDIVTKRVAKLLEPSAANLPKLCDTHGRALAKSAHYFIHQGHYIFGGFCRDWIGRGKTWPSADLDVACCAQKTKEAIAGFKIWTAEQGLVFASQGTKGRNVT